MISYKFFKSAVQSLIRNRWLAFATITVMTLTLSTISVFLLANYFIENSIVNVKSKIDLEVFFKNDATESMIFDIKREIVAMPEIKNVTYISKDEAFKIFKESNKDSPELYETVNASENPLPASLKIDLKSSESLEKINNFFRGGKYESLVYKTSYENNKKIADWLLSVAGYVQVIGWSLIGVLGFISFVVVLNTIRMTIYARKEEVEIMKLVGATNWYIRWPFLLEGAFYGFISIIFSSAIIYSVFVFVATPYLVNNPFFTDISKGYVDYVALRTPVILLYQFAMSILVGALSSMAALGRYLKI